ncbi:MAG: hypothetical protein A3F13_05705 [Gammaproteobacteria bacterium RIFCSPHIGHO2_12_FULL_40_19]|nr:MAG: hypothetical protein A3F13_05705 [Gammaproteobacteria bacterium RIFCSPHIGHO2_12_FULL_40_19]
MSRRISTALREARSELKALLCEDLAQAPETQEAAPKTLPIEPIVVTLPKPVTTHLEPIVLNKRAPIELDEILAAAKANEFRTAPLSLTTEECIRMGALRPTGKLPAVKASTTTAEKLPFSYNEWVAIAHQRNAQDNLPDITPQLIAAAQARKIKRPQPAIAETANALSRRLNRKTNQLLEGHPDICAYLKSTMIPEQMTDRVITLVCAIKESLRDKGYAFSTTAIKMAFEKPRQRTILKYFIENALPLPTDITIFFHPRAFADLERIMIEHNSLLYAQGASDQDGTHKLDYTAERIRRRTNLHIIRRELEEVFKKIDDKKPHQKLTTPLPRLFAAMHTEDRPIASHQNRTLSDSTFRACA